MIAFVWKPFLIVTGLLLLLTYLWLQSTNPELNRRAQFEDTVRQVELRHTELMRDILLARAGLLPNYDTLTKSGYELNRLTQSLKQQIEPNNTEAEKNFGLATESLSNTINDQLSLVEYFKSDNALLRNSVMYFGLVGNHLRNRIHDKNSGKIGSLWQIMFNFMVKPDPGLAQQIQAQIEGLERQKPLSPDIQALITHGRFITEVMPKLDTLLRTIIDAPVMAGIHDLRVVANRYSDGVELRAQKHRLSLYLVALILVGYLLYQFYKLRKYTSDLQIAHRNLHLETAERIQAETALRESEEQLRAITESAHEAIVSADNEGNIVSWNRGATVMFGYAADAALGLALQRIFAVSSWPSLKLFPTEADNAAVELTGVRRDGSEFPLEVSFSNWMRGAKCFLTVIIREISARKRLEEITRQQEAKLIQANKMTALGTLVSGVAHEINNPNQLILMNGGLLADALDDTIEILNEHFEKTGDFMLGGLPFSEMRNTLPILAHDIKDGAKRIERIVADLKNFASPQLGNTQRSFSLNEVVEGAIRLLNPIISRKSANFRIALGEPSAILQGDPQQIEQIAVNLIVNALEALLRPDCGVTVATLTDKAGHLARLEVRDEGCGIAPEHLDQLCDPFFTTKQGSGGTGLGLAITASLVLAQGGRLSFASEPGKGTCASVEFPLAGD